MMHIKQRRGESFADYLRRAVATSRTKPKLVREATGISAYLWSQILYRGQSISRALAVALDEFFAESGCETDFEQASMLMHNVIRVSDTPLEIREVIVALLLQRYTTADLCEMRQKLGLRSADSGYR